MSCIAGLSSVNCVIHVGELRRNLGNVREVNEPNRNIPGIFSEGFRKILKDVNLRGTLHIRWDFPC